MSNPTPILNNINAFDATKGTTISFNIIGGTDIVRSNIVYIYDLSTNDLICTHLYISTESIHELPPNTDPSIVYASGKSSEDFINNKNYYLQIQTFTNTAGTTGGSGMSVAKTFWCLSNPSLSVNAIPAAISTTSYNVGATYNTNVTDTSIHVTNIIQQYKFDLYTATGTLVQTSGNIIGSGEQEGTSTTYNITYNFSGLVVNSSYYVVVTTTSTEGMTVSAQSNTFTVSIETPTVGAATATNNSCDGYISVVSNLSSEYGGSASGEIASFETDSVNNVSSLKVNMEPIQDLHGYDHPWVGGAGKNKFDASTVLQGYYISDNSGELISGDASIASDYIEVDAGQTYFISPTLSSGNWGAWYDENKVFISGITGYSTAKTAPSNAKYMRFTVSRNGSNPNYATTTQVEIGSTATSFEPYSNICPISGRNEAKAYVAGFNQWDEEWEVGAYSSVTGEKVATSGRIRCKSMIPVIAGTTYYIKAPNSLQIYRYDADGNYIDWISGTQNQTRVFADDTCFITFNCAANSGTTYNHDISINYPSTDHDYHPYQGQTYTTDLNQTVYGGTLDMATGVLTVDRKMASGKIESLPANTYTNIQYGRLAKPNDSKNRGNIGTHNLISSMYEVDTATDHWDDTSKIGKMFVGADYNWIWVGFPIGTTLAEMQSMTENNEIAYELAEPQTYQLTPHQIQTLVGQNNIWSDAGSVEVTFNLPITNLLVKRQDTSDTSGKWLTLYSQPITQASDMDFTYIDFLNQHGKTYRYALVPLLTQQQGDVDVEIEGGYTVSDDVLSVFDGVFIANSNGSQKLKAATEYGDLETNQDVGVLTTIGGKYPFVVSNSNLNYHSGSISALIVPSDFYTNGDLDRLDIVERREAIEQFLTDKTAKILKDWNGNIWLITFIENVEVSFVDDYGMGLGTLSAKWVEIGDVNDQTDLQQTGLI